MKIYKIISTLLLLTWIHTVESATPPNEEKVDPDEILLIDDYPSPYDNQDIQLNALLWKPETEGKYPAIIMMHGVGGLYYKSDDNCDDSDQTCWRISGKFRYWGKLLSRNHKFSYKEKFIVIAPDSHTPRGYDHHGVSNIDAQDRLTNVSSYLGRPWDLYAALRYLKTRDDVDTTRIFALGFSDGGGAVVSSISSSLNSPMVEQSQLFEGINTLTLEGKTSMKNLGLKGVVALYPSCGFFGHYDNQYQNYAPLLVQTGLSDNVTPISECNDRQTEALNLGVKPNDFKTIGYENMDHGFEYLEYDTYAACLATKRTIEHFSKHSGDYLFSDSFEDECL